MPGADPDVSIVHEPARAATRKVPSGSSLDRSELFAAKLRATRAVMDWSQTDLANRLGITQRAVYMIEHARVDVRKSTATAIGELFDQLGIQFEPLPDGGFLITVPGRILERGRPR